MVALAVCAGVVGAMGAAAGPAWGQMLNLDAPAAPRANEGQAVLALAERLREDVARREKGVSGLKGDRLVAARLEIATRRLARALLMKGEELGEAGSVHVLAGLTLSGRQRELDAVARRVRSGRVEKGARLAAELLVAEIERVQGMVPARVEDLDRALRDLFAVPVEAGLVGAGGARVWEGEDAGRVGWVPAGGAAGEKIDTDLGAAAGRWAGVGGGGAEFIAAVRAFEAEVVGPARGVWAYRGAAEGIAGALVAAGRVIEPGGVPEWTPEGARTALAARFVEAGRRAMEAATRERGMRELGDLVRCGAVLWRLERLSTQAVGPARPSPRAVQAARGAALAAVAATETGSEGARAALAALETALELIGERATLGTEEALVRETRPAWRVLEAEVRRTEMDLWEVLGRISPQGIGPMSDPAVVAPIAAHRRSLEDLRAVVAISRWLGAAEGGGAPLAPGPGGGGQQQFMVQRNLALQRVLRLGQDLSVASKRESALATLRRLAADLDELMAFPGEGELRIGGAEWNAVTGGRGVDLVSRIDAMRQAWLEAWVRERDGAGGGGGSAGGSEGVAEQLRRCRGLVSAMHDAATFRPLRAASREPGPGEAFMAADEGGIRAWPGWELSDMAAQRLYDGVEARLGRACQLFLEGHPTSAAAVDAAVREFEEKSSVVRLGAALERGARARRIARVPVLVELAAPPATGVGGVGVWMAGARQDLAAVCRYAEEYAHAVERKDGARAAALLAYINDRARAVLERLSQPGRGG